MLLGYWIASGHPIGWQHLTEAALSQSGHARLWPEIQGLGTIAFLAGIVLLFAGVEVQAVYVTEMKNPSREYPAAIGLGSVISLLIFALGAIPIAAILPYDKISLQSGVFDTFNAVIAIFGMPGGSYHSCPCSSAPSLALLGHTDVVPATAEEWGHDPFGGGSSTARSGEGVPWTCSTSTATMATGIQHLGLSGFRPR